MATIPQWIQTALFESNVVEVVISVGIISAPNHVQVQVETRDPISNKLLDLWSCPHAELDHLPNLLRECLVKASEHIQGNVVLDSHQDTLFQEISDAAPPRC